MAALTAGRKVSSRKMNPYDGGYEITFSIAATTVIFEGAFCRLDAGGDIVPCDGQDDPLFPCVGMALQTVDNDPGADADRSVILLCGAMIEHAVGSAVKDDIGKRAYAVDDQTLGLAATDEFVGWIVGMADNSVDPDLFMVKMALAGQTDAAHV